MALSGDDEKYLHTIETQISHDYKLKAGRRTLVPGFFNGSSFEPNINFAPGMISPLATSNAYMIIDECCYFIAKDSSVKIIPTRFSFTTNGSVN